MSFVQEIQRRGTHVADTRCAPVPAFGEAFDTEAGDCVWPSILPDIAAPTGERLALLGIKSPVDHGKPIEKDGIEYAVYIRNCTDEDACASGYLPGGGSLRHLAIRKGGRRQRGGGKRITTGRGVAEYM